MVFWVIPKGHFYFCMYVSVMASFIKVWLSISTNHFLKVNYILKNRSIINNAPSTYRNNFKLQCCIAMVLVVGILPSLPAQVLPYAKSNFTQKKVPVVFPIQIISEQASIVPGSFIMQNVSKDLYRVDYISSYIIWSKKPSFDSVVITYRTFPLLINKVTQRYDFEALKNNALLDNPFVLINKTKPANSFLDFGTLQSNGAFGREISLGNNQDASLRSSLNLQLNGYIADSIEITAAITDNNIPIQPDGNTQDLRDFDRIFFEAKKKNWKVSLGDIDIRQSKNYFLNFYKRLQGIAVDVNSKVGKNITNNILVSGAVAKGKFARNIITPLEGNQGPYRLRGNNNELFFVVLANTERVFIDGVKLQRGEDQDYVINYNTAEVTFTSKKLITKDLRIQIEFEYSDRNFLNSQLYVNDEVNIGKKLKLSLAAFNNIDAKNSAIDQVLGKEEKNFLFQIGDSIASALFRNATLDTFKANKILYRKVDTLVNATTYPNVYVLTNSPTDIVYTLAFSLLGQGKGNYIQLQNASNGRAFKWVAPLLGVPQGDWEPVSLLVTPKKLQLFTLGSEYLLSNFQKLKVDVAMSNYDVNLFSTKNKNDNTGAAAKVQLLTENKQISFLKNSYTLQSNIAYEFAQARFKPIERLRTVEFLRDWSLPFDAPLANENISNIAIAISNKNNNSIGYEFMHYNRSDGYNGFKQKINQKQKLFGINTFTEISLTTFTADTQKGTFFRPLINIDKNFIKFKNVQTGFKYFGEFNNLTDKPTAKLNATSFGFNVYEWYVKSNQAKLNKWGANFIKRNDLLPFNNKLATANESNNYNFFIELLKNQKHQMKFTGTYRDLKIANESISSQKADKSILGRAEYLLDEWKGFLHGSFLYEVGSGQEVKREFSYLEVPAGQGLYTWIDYNTNGVPELNEFEVALFADQKKYIRIFTPTNQFIKANYLQFNYAIDLDPRILLGASNKNNIFKVLKKINTNSSLQINKKAIAKNNFIFNPFEKNIIDTSLITLNSFFSNTIFYNRSSAKFGLEFTQSNRALKAILAYGFESQNVNNIQSKMRIGIKKSLVANILVKQSNNVLNTAASKFVNRNYNVLIKTIEPSLGYVYKSTIRANVGLTYSQRKNTIDSLEKSLNTALFTEVKYNILSSSSLTLKFTYNTINLKAYTGAANTTVGYLLLEGLLPGKNYLWEANFTKRFANNLEVNVQYLGRQSANSKTIQSGSASLRAFF